MARPARLNKKELSSVLRNYVSIEERTNVSDGEGGFTEVWATVSGYSNVPAEVTSIYGFQQSNYKSFNENVTYFITFRGEINLTESINRIIFNNRIFDIIVVEDIGEKGIEKRCNCKERRK